MKSLKLILLLLILPGMILFSCKSDSSSKSADEKEQSEDTSDKSESEDDESSNEDLAKAMDGLKAGEVVDFRVLKDALPDRLVGLDRTSHTGQKTGVMGFKISNAEATYEKGDQSIKATITDTGGMGMAMTGMAVWTSMEIDNETDDGYERTTMIDGKKAFEKYNKTSKEGEVAVIYNNRIIVTLNGQNVSMDDLHTAIKKIDI